MLTTLVEIHKRLFDNFEYVTDLKKHGAVEYWEAIPSTFKSGDPWASDCEDFAMACRKLARDAEIDDTRLVACFDETGAGHCVLEWRGYILDNRFKQVVTRKFLDAHGYKWIAISGMNPGDPWHRVK